MREYETTFIVQPEISDEGAKELLDRVDALLERSGAIRLLHDDQGKRRLAYDIAKRSEGIYAVVDMKATPDVAKELDRQLNLNESVLRTKVLRPEAR
jgi:small subunit ribosomal protein S6